jgi:TolA-binding protein
MVATGAAKASPTIDGLSPAQLELKLAKLWARVDDLATKLIRQQEKVRMLEKGLMLGVIPEGLTPTGTQRAPVESNAKGVSPEPKSANATDPAPTESAQESVSKPRQPYSELLSKAQSLFNAGKYGQSIAAYQKIGDQYPDRTRQGQHLYWIGLGWYYLKEDNLATENLERLVETFPKSAWLPKAHFYLAKIELRRGLRQRALKRLRRVVDEFAGQDVAEMARYEIEQLQESL